jgi:hypothetical protein
MLLLTINYGLEIICKSLFTELKETTLGSEEETKRAGFPDRDPDPDPDPGSSSSTFSYIISTICFA